MQHSEENIKAAINPRIVGWYLFNEIKQLKQLKQREEELLLELEHFHHPYNANTIEEIVDFARQKKQIMFPLKQKLRYYENFFEAHAKPKPKPGNGNDGDNYYGYDFKNYEEYLDFFESNLSSLNSKNDIDQFLIELAYKSHEHAEKNNSIIAGTMGERLFKIVPNEINAKKCETVSNEITRDTSVITTDKPVQLSALRVEAAIFIPSSFKIHQPIAVRPLMFQKSTHQQSVLDDPCEKADLSEMQFFTDEPLKNSKLYKYWKKS